MIPVKLAMRNFMCYHDNVPPIYFDGIHVACICGDNGNGKSALIDAMTWALWGQTRAKNDDDLIYSGQNEVEVEFDFAVGQDSYRIIRKHSRPKRRGRSGQTILEFQIATGDGFRSITDNSLRLTQRKIVDVLHMDYPTFINSAFLLQGHADEFTIKRPVERKEVLANILGFSFYDELEKQARDLARQQEIEKAQLESVINGIGDELAQKSAYKAELELAQGELTRIERDITGHESRLASLRQKRDFLENRRWQLTQLNESIAVTKRDMARWEEQARQHHTQIGEYEKLIARRSVIEEGYSQLSSTRKLNEELNRKLGLMVRLNERKSRLEKAIAQARAGLLTAHAVAQSKIGELEKKSQRLPQLRSGRQQIELQRNRLAELEQALQEKRRNSQEIRAKINYMESGKAQLEREIGEIDEKLNLLLSQGDARCPLCETELGREELKLIEAKYADEKASKSSTLKLNVAELALKKKGLELLDDEISRLEAKINQDKALIQSRAGVIDIEISEAEEAGSKLDDEVKRLAEIEQQLARNDFATGEQQALHVTETELAGLDYRAAQHEQARHRLDELEQYENPKRRLEEADRLISQEQEAVCRAEEAARELYGSLEVADKKRQELSGELDLLPQLVDELAQAETEHKTLLQRQKEAQEIIGSVKGKLNRLSELEVKRGEKERLLAQALKEEVIFKELAQAFGKRGIQALLIETALPEIEVEANKLLGRMTDNRMHVKIETQGETKKGDLIETLDIKISDELGTRNYEMFSGGEAFRINFAIRIALSKLLARRAGASLPTLIIDEGFGTQDTTGIEKVKEAINSIQDDFDKILVITHIEELKDAFPARINVIKTATGSTLSMS